MKIAHKKNVRKKNRKIIFSLLAVVLLAAFGWAGYVGYQQKQDEIRQRKLALQHERDMREKEEQGYEIINEYGWKSAVWRVGKIHPKNNNLVADSQEGRWVCKKPGYVWESGPKMKWTEGVMHPENPDLISSASEGIWICKKPGYVWTENAEIAWRSGQTSDQYPHWVSIEKKDYWRPQEGYCKKNPKEKGLGELIWNPEAISDDGTRKASQREGIWLSKTPCKACQNGKIKRSIDCPTCGGSARVETKKTCSSCSGSGEITSSTCGSCGGKGYWYASETCSNCGGVHSQQCNPVGLFVQKPVYAPNGLHVVKCMFCGGNGVVGFPPWQAPCNNCGGQGWTRCGHCGGDGVWECPRCTNGKISRSHRCSECGGSGTSYSTSKCGRCGGTGEEKDDKPCPDCSYGKVKKEFDCSECGGKSYVWK